MLFRVSYIDDAGVKKQAFLSALSEDSLRASPAFNNGGLVSESRINDSLVKFLVRQLTLDQQMLILSQISAAVGSGSSIAVVREIVEESPLVGRAKNDPRFRHASTITDFLEMCHMESAVIMMVKAGEESGRLAESIEDAIMDIKARIDLESATKGDLSKGFFYMIAGFSMLVGLSKMLNDIITQMMDADRFAANLGTHTLLFINELFGNYALFTVGAIVGTLLALRQSWGKSALLRDLPLFKTYNTYKKAQRSIRFLATWRPLFLSGVPMMTALTQVKDALSGMDKTAMESMIEEIRMGKSVSQSLDKRFWSLNFVNTMKAFDGSTDEAKKQLMDRIQISLAREMQSYGTILSRIVMMMGMAAALASILLMAGGFYLPLIGGLKTF